MTFWQKERQNKPTKSGLPVFSVDTQEQAESLQVHFCRLVTFPSGSNSGEHTGYVFSGFNPFDENGNTDLEKMNSEMDRVIESFQAHWDKWMNKEEGR